MLTSRLSRFTFAALAMVSLTPAMAGEFEDALSRALDNSRAIESARQGVRSAIEALPIAEQTMNLSTELSVSGSTADVSTNDGPYNNVETGSVTVTLRQPLYDGGIADAQRGVRRLEVDQARTQLSVDEQAVLLNAIETFVTLVVARDRVALEEANAKRLEEYLKATEIRVQVGESTPTDLAATRAQLARARASLITARTDLANSTESYRLDMELPPAGLALPGLPADLPGSALEAGEWALQSHPGHRQVYLGERASRQRLDVLVANIRPKVDFSVSGKTAESSSVTRTSDELAASVTMTMPLFPNKTVRATARSRVADHRAAMFRLIDSERSIRLAAENAFRTYQAASMVIDAYGAELEAAVLLRDGTISEVEFGLKTVLDQLDAEQDVVNARVNLLLANRDRIIAAYGLMAATGSLSAQSLGLDSDAVAPDETPIDFPVVLRPLPLLDYPE